MTFSDVTKEEQLKAKYEKIIDEELKDGDSVMISKTIRVELVSVGLSLICKTYHGKRKEFSFTYLECIKFITVDSESKKEIQLKIAYAQIDNNISHKPLFSTIMYPKELA